MFAKPAKPSGSSLLKNKDVKKLRKDAAVRFSCDDALVLAFAPTKVCEWLTTRSLSLKSAV